LNQNSKINSKYSSYDKHPLEESAFDDVDELEDEIGGQSSLYE